MGSLRLHQQRQPLPVTCVIPSSDLRYATRENALGVQPWKISYAEYAIVPVDDVINQFGRGQCLNHLFHGVRGRWIKGPIQAYHLVRIQVLFEVAWHSRDKLRAENCWIDRATCDRDLHNPLAVFEDFHQV